MLNQLEYIEPPATSQTRVVTGQWLTGAKLSKRERAHLAAQWYLDQVEVKPTIAMATAAFKVSQPYISEALADLREAAAKKTGSKRLTKRNGNGKLKRNGNGAHDYVVVHDYAKLPFVPNISDVWSHLTNEEREAFARAHIESVWATLEAIT